MGRDELPRSYADNEAKSTSENGRAAETATAEIPDSTPISATSDTVPDAEAGTGHPTPEANGNDVSTAAADADRPASAANTTTTVNGELSPAAIEAIARAARAAGYWVPPPVPENWTPPPRSLRPKRPALGPVGPRPGVPTTLVHGFVLVVIVSVVLGRGYWDMTPQSPHVGGVDVIGDVRGVSLMASRQTLGSGIGAQTLGTASGTMAGYVSQFASAVAPGHLSIDSVVAEEGDTIADIAQATGRSVPTLLWANGLSNPAEALAAGTQVRVPPVDGMLHIINDGDTLESIAARYGVEVETITGYTPNHVESNADLVPLRMLMVPGGQMPKRDRVLTYTVRPGDTLASIAQSFGLHPDTIIWANSLPDGNLILPGQHLAILPTDGVMVTVEEGDTIEGIAEHYGVEPDAIRDYPLNGLGAGGQLRVGQQVMVPGGRPPAPPPAPEAPAAPASESSSSRAATGRLLWPTTGRITQYYGPTDFWMEPAYMGYAHFHQGIDFGNVFGTPIVAADSGVVIFSGWSNAGLGYAVAIDHGNGLTTWYGHMNSWPPVAVGERVERGQYIGPMGSTGASTGPHLHFAVLKNGVWVDPLDYLR